MADIRQTRKQFVIVASILAAMTALSLAYLAFPVGASNTELNSDLTQINKDLGVKESQAKPLRGLPEKLVKTNQDILKFYRERLPAQQSDVSEELGKLSSAQGVSLSDVKYADYDTDIPGLREVAVEAQLSGEYAKIARFLNAVQRDKTFLIVDEVNLQDEKGGTVRLQIQLETYLRPAFAEGEAAVGTPNMPKLPPTTTSNKPKVKK